MDDCEFLEIRPGEKARGSVMLARAFEILNLRFEILVTNAVDFLCSKLS